MEQLEIKNKSEYGAPELKRVYRKHATIALIIALAFHFLGVGAYWGAVHLGDPEPAADKDMVRIPYDRILLPSTWIRPVTPVAATATARLKPSMGTPVPVPPHEANPDATIPTQDEYDSVRVSGERGAAEGVRNLIDIDKDDAPPREYEPYERAPEVVKQIPPKYPDLATRAGLEGTVWVKIWVDKVGRPRKVVVQKSDAEIFNQPATEAAMQWVFTPAMMKNGPVSVWVSIPFRFKLQGK
jgi:protein TonB